MHSPSPSIPTQNDPFQSSTTSKDVGAICLQLEQQWTQSPVSKL